MEKSNIRFYEVKQCGLFKPHGRNASVGSFQAITDNVFNWSKVKKRLVQSTCTYEINDDFEMDFLETYLVSVKKENSNGDFIITTWNKTHDSGNSVYALDPGTTIDSVNAKAFHKGNLPATSIPGYATYFWMLPSINTMATITFGSPRSGMAPFSYWLESFINTQSRYCHLNPAGNKIIGYSDGSSPPNSELEARFKRFLHKNPAKKEMIVKNRSKISKIIKRVKLDRTQIVHTKALDSLSRIFGFSQKPELTDSELSLTYEMGYTPTKDQLKEIISTYESSDCLTNWEDVGFVFPENNSFGANKKEWLSKSYAKTKLQLDVDWIIPGQLLNTEKLIETIQSRRPELIKLLDI